MCLHVVIFWNWLLAKLFFCAIYPRPSPFYCCHHQYNISHNSEIYKLVSLLIGAPTQQETSPLPIGHIGRHPAITTSFLLILLNGDIQLNPAPTRRHVPKFPCGCCQDDVDFGQKAICCDSCDVWFHHTCASMSNSQYSDLHSRTDWFCYCCKSSRINSYTYHSYEFGIPTSNSFATCAILISSYNSSSHCEGSTGWAPSLTGTPSPSVPRPHIESAHVTCDNAFAGTTSSGPDPSQFPNYYPRDEGAQWRSIMININSLVGKVSHVQSLLAFTKPDSVVITETKLNPSINTVEVIPPEWGYADYCRDLPDSTCGAGVMLVI